MSVKNNWEYSEIGEKEDGSEEVIYYDAVWNDIKGIPRLNIEGLYITIGMRFFDY